MGGLARSSAVRIGRRTPIFSWGGGKVPGSVSEVRAEAAGGALAFDRREDGLAVEERQAKVERARVGTRHFAEGAEWIGQRVHVARQNRGGAGEAVRAAVGCRQRLQGRRTVEV